MDVARCFAAPVNAAMKPFGVEDDDDVDDEGCSSLAVVSLVAAGTMATADGLASSPDVMVEPLF